ncbi:MAG: hypothetical protein HY274_02930 [Gammaproteobacteria bacterium]|nr:hypothetical protein [Gammaproteobacteria bacterium]
MRQVYCLVCILSALSGCASVSVAPIASESYLGYQPIDPVPAPKVKVYDNAKNAEKEIFWESIKNGDAKRALLPIQSAQVAVTKTDISGKATYLTAAVSGEAGSYKVVMDYMKYRVEDVYDVNHVLVGSGRVGVGLRINAEVVTTKSNLDLSGIMAIGVNASEGNLRGGISVDVIGIDSKDVTNLIPLTASIDQSSIQAALQALASIKTKLWETTTITPHLVAILPAQPSKQREIKMQLIR